MSFHFPAQLTSCTLWMEASSHTALLNIDQTTVQHTPDECSLNSDSHDNLKSCTVWKYKTRNEMKAGLLITF